MPSPFQSIGSCSATTVHVPFVPSRSCPYASRSRLPVRARDPGAGCAAGEHRRGDVPRRPDRGHRAARQRQQRQRGDFVAGDGIALALRADARDLGAGQPADAIDVVDRVPEKRPAVARLALPRRQRREAAARENPLGDHPDLADAAFANQAMRREIADAEALPEHDHQPHLRGARRLDDPIAIGDRRRHRLVEQHVFAVRRGGDRLRRVIGRRRADQHGIDVVAGDERVDR